MKKGALRFFPHVEHWYAVKQGGRVVFRLDVAHPEGFSTRPRT